jgi:hypothetical protein
VLDVVAPPTGRQNLFVCHPPRPSFIPIRSQREIPSTSASCDRQWIPSPCVFTSVSVLPKQGIISSFCLFFFSQFDLKYRLFGKRIILIFYVFYVMHAKGLFLHQCTSDQTDVFESPGGGLNMIARLTSAPRLAWCRPGRDAVRSHLPSPTFTASRVRPGLITGYFLTTCGCRKSIRESWQVPPDLLYCSVHSVLLSQLRPSTFRSYSPTAFSKAATTTTSA